MGMVRFLLLSSFLFLSTNEKWASFLLDKDEDFEIVLESYLLTNWLKALLDYELWYRRASFDYTITASDLLEPPAFVFRSGATE